MTGPSPAKRILIADDDHAFLEVLTEFFQEARSGYTVETVDTGAKAVAALVRERPALILLDVAMPGLGGLDTLNMLRTLAPNVPVLVVTGGGSAVGHAALNSGAFAYLPKPVDLDQFQQFITRALHTSGADSSASASQPH